MPKPHKAMTAWSDKDKMRAITVYKSLSNQTKTSDVTGIPLRTLIYWMQTDWWKEKMQVLKAEDSAELEEAATSIAKQSQEIVKERLANGDFILNRDGDIVRKPVSARDASIIGAIAIDKRKILQEEPVREQQLGTSERLLKLVEQFARLTSATEIKGMLKTTTAMEQKPVETEYTVIEELPPSGILETKDDINQNA